MCRNHTPSGQQSLKLYSLGGEGSIHLCTIMPGAVTRGGMLKQFPEIDPLTDFAKGHRARSNKFTART
jgi:hypothetical protein